MNADNTSLDCLSERVLGEVSQLSAGFRPDRVPSRQFPEAQSRVEAGRSWLYRRAQGAGGSRVDQLVCPAFFGHYTRLLLVTAPFCLEMPSPLGVIDSLSGLQLSRVL